MNIPTKFTKEYLTGILEHKDYDDFVRLHPAIWTYRELLLDDCQIFSIDGTQLSSEQILSIKKFIPPYTFVLLYTNKSGEKQAFFNYHNGTTGEEGDSVKAMWDAHRKLSSIKKDKNIKWTTLL